MCHTLRRFMTEAVARIAVLLATGTVVLGAPPPTPQATPDRIVLENQVCRYEIGRDGKNLALVNLADRKDYLARPRR